MEFFEQRDFRGGVFDEFFDESVNILRARLRLRQVQAALPKEVFPVFPGRSKLFFTTLVGASRSGPPHFPALCQSFPGNRACYFTVLADLAPGLLP